MKIKVINKSKHKLSGSSPDELAGETKMRPGSGLAIKKEIKVFNSPGTIGADYRGEDCVIFMNLSNEKFVIEDGERICQMITAKHEMMKWMGVESLLNSERGSSGFGHTGKK